METGADTLNAATGGILTVNAGAGYLTNFTIAGGKLKADWHLPKSHERFAQALELAEVTAFSPQSMVCQCLFFNHFSKGHGLSSARVPEVGGDPWRCR